MTPSDAVKVLRDAARTRKAGKYKVAYSDDVYARMEEGDEKVRACAYGVLALSAGLEVEQVANLLYGPHEKVHATPLHQFVNVYYNIPPSLSARMENESDEKGWTAASRVLEAGF